ncbi:MAG: PEP-CTERM sorting domain-containing protein [Akkermansia sp.]|nr:PEP-CTERM sorting domain-containing protein [Akkermansia sp.]
MKLHLPLTLLTAVLAAYIALPAQAVEAPDTYNRKDICDSDILANYTTNTEADYYAFLLGKDIVVPPDIKLDGGNLLFTTNENFAPVSLVFSGSNSSALINQDSLVFDTLSHLSISDYSNGGISTHGNLVIQNVNDGIDNPEIPDVLFSGNTSTNDIGGGAIYTENAATINRNGWVIFSGNSGSSATRYEYGGGAIYAGDVVTISENEKVTFLENCITSRGNGGAIYAENTVIISKNAEVSFSGNYFNTTGFTSYGGGAICAGNTVTISENGDVTFAGNYSSGSGAAIYASRVINISNNKEVAFTDNYTYDGWHGGGAIAGKEINIHENENVSFIGNSASVGGALYTLEGSGGNVSIRGNGNVIFSGNSITPNGRSYYKGGAISTNGNVSILGNDTVCFEKNHENKYGTYRLRSIYSSGSGGINLSAKTGGYITFYDSVYTGGDSYFNSDYVDAEGNTQSTKGDIIFSGKYAEQHLNEILAANNEGRTATAEEILNSQTSTIEGNAYLNGGSLQIKDGAVFNVNGDTVNIAAGSNATLAISDAELVAANATVEVGEATTLQLSNGAAVTADEINIAAGATLALVDVAITTSTSDLMVAAYRVSSLNVINADLTFAAGSTLVTDGTGINMTEGSVLTFNATSEGEKINLVFTLGTEYGEEGLVQLFSNVDIVKFLMDGKEMDASTTLLASDFFTGDCINENTTLHYDSNTNMVYLQGVSKVVPEPTTATLSLLALAALAMRRRRK